jgi:hypothetical protein
MNPAEVLEKAADLLETVGWVQGDEVVYVIKEDDGLNTMVGLCARGACKMAVGLDPEAIVWSHDNPPMKEFAAALSFLNGAAGLAHEFSIVKWNDYPGRTAAKVIDLMKKVAKDLRNEANPLEVSA